MLYVSTYIKDSNEFREKLKQFEPLPSNARMHKTDAASMHTNIETNHGLQILRNFLEKLKRNGQLPPDFDIEIILKAAEIVMLWNIFEFGDCYFRQLIGTAMGTPAACPWLIIYYFQHESEVLIPKYGQKLPLIARFINDLFGIVLMGGKNVWLNQNGMSLKTI